MENFKHTKNFNSIDIFTNIDRIYNNIPTAPWDKKGSERGMNSGDLFNIVVESINLSHKLNVIYGIDNWMSVVKKLKKLNIDKLELIKVGVTFQLKEL